MIGESASAQIGSDLDVTMASDEIVGVASLLLAVNDPSATSDDRRL